MLKSFFNRSLLIIVIMAQLLMLPIVNAEIDAEDFVKRMINKAKVNGWSPEQARIEFDKCAREEFGCQGTTAKSGLDQAVTDTNYVLDMMRSANDAGTDPIYAMEATLRWQREQRDRANREAWRAKHPQSSYDYNTPSSFYYDSNSIQKQIDSDEAYARQLQSTYDQIDSDEAYARQLQSQYDEDYARQLQYEYDNE